MNLFKCDLKTAVEVIRDKLSRYESEIKYHKHEVERIEQELKELKEQLKNILL